MVMKVKMKKMDCTCALSCMNSMLFISFAHFAQFLGWRVRTQAGVLHNIGHSGGKPPRMTQSSPVDATGFPGTLTWRVVSSAPHFSPSPIEQAPASPIWFQLCKDSAPRHNQNPNPNKQQIQPLPATRNNVQCPNSNSTTHKIQILNAGVALQSLVVVVARCSFILEYFIIVQSGEK